jgi:hypothetical protein
MEFRRPYSHRSMMFSSTASSREVSYSVELTDIQCCGSGMFYPGSGAQHFFIPDPKSVHPGFRILLYKKRVDK